jgi:hypothetical protein
MALCITAKAQQTLDDCGRIILNTYLPDDSPMPVEARRALETKLNQITTTYGMGGSQMNPRFIITAGITVGTKDIIAGPPQKVALNIELTLFIGDAIENKKYANTAIALQGVGENENKALIDAIKTINTRSKEIKEFVESGKTKIITYYSTQCDFILKKANTLASQYKFNEAIYELMMVPEVCKECYFKSKDEVGIIFKKKIENDCVEKLKQAKLNWVTEPTEKGAMKASAILVSIIPSDNCRTEINKLSEEIKKKLQTDQQKKYDFEMLEMQKKYDTEQKRFDLQREIAEDQAKNQPKTITYNTIYWR